MYQYTPTSITRYIMKLSNRNSFILNKTNSKSRNILKITDTMITMTESERLKYNDEIMRNQWKRLNHVNDIMQSMDENIQKMYRDIKYADANEIDQLRYLVRQEAQRMKNVIRETVFGTIRQTERYIQEIDS